ncbi:doublesex- and mab-3-related transcription factor 1-like isoform X1 [Lates japonicus]
MVPDKETVPLREMPHSDSCLSSHSVSSQYRMHSYYPAATYLTQGLSSTTCVPPIFSLEDNNNNNNNNNYNCSEAMTASFSSSSLTTAHTPMTCRSINSLVNSDVKVECEAGGEMANFTVIDVDTTK